MFYAESMLESMRMHERMLMSIGTDHLFYNHKSKSFKQNRRKQLKKNRRK